MIELCTGADVERLIRRAVRSSARVREFAIVSPFLDACGAEHVARLCEVPKRFRFRVHLTTRPETYQQFGPLLRRLDLKVSTRPRLHAKVYSLRAIDPVETEAIVTSANLTRGGLRSNLELGFRITSTDPRSRALLDRIVHWSTKYGGGTWPQPQRNPTR